MGILDSVPGIIANAAGPVFKAANLYRVTGRASDNRGGFTPTFGAAIPCLALQTNYSDFIRGISNGAITARERKFVVIAQSLPGGTVPKIGDKIEQGEAWEVTDAKSDPARATYTLRVKPAA